MSDDQDPDKDRDKTDSGPEDLDDVTEIVPAPGQDEGSSDDVTRIIMSTPVETPKQALPGTVIGVAGSLATASATSGEDTSEDATKILFSESRSGIDVTETSDIAADDEDSATSQTDPVSDVPVATEPSETINTEPQSVGQTSDEDSATVFLTPAAGVSADQDFNPPVGWLVVVDGPGRGETVNVFYGQNTIGRGDDQRIRLNFGDKSISREVHAYLLYDEVARKYFVRDSGKANIVRVNRSPVMAPVEIKSHDFLQVGATTLLFVALCNDKFDWAGTDQYPETALDEDGGET